jgi:hypothetical protein
MVKIVLETMTIRIQRIHINKLLLYFIPLCCANADLIFSGPIRMRGKVDGKTFQSELFKIEPIEGGFVIGSHQRKRTFLFKTDAKVLHDAVLSINHSAVAIYLRNSNESGDSQAVLATINTSGDTRIYNYRMQRMTEHFGWLVELGAVSDDGKLILAKCAKYLPEENGIQAVNHRWAILAIADDSLKVLDVLELESALTKWAKYTSVNR